MYTQPLVHLQLPYNFSQNVPRVKRPSTIIKCFASTLVMLTKFFIDCAIFFRGYHTNTFTCHSYQGWSWCSSQTKQSCNKQSDRWEFVFLKIFTSITKNFAVYAVYPCCTFTSKKVNYLFFCFVHIGVTKHFLEKFSRLPCNNSINLLLCILLTFIKIR